MGLGDINKLLSDFKLSRPSDKSLSQPKLKNLLQQIFDREHNEGLNYRLKNIKSEVSSQGFIELMLQLGYHYFNPEGVEQVPPAQIVERLFSHIRGYPDALPSLQHVFKDIKNAEAKTRQKAILAELTEQVKQDPDFELPDGYAVEIVKTPLSPAYQMCWSIVNDILEDYCEMSVALPRQEQIRVVVKQEAKSERQQSTKPTRAQQLLHFGRADLQSIQPVRLAARQQQQKVKVIPRRSFQKAVLPSQTTPEPTAESSAMQSQKFQLPVDEEDYEDEDFDYYGSVNLNIKQNQYEAPSGRSVLTQKPKHKKQMASSPFVPPVADTPRASPLAANKPLSLAQNRRSLAPKQEARLDLPPVKKRVQVVAPGPQRSVSAVSAHDRGQPPGAVMNRVIREKLQKEKEEEARKLQDKIKLHQKQLELKKQLEQYEREK